MAPVRMTLAEKIQAVAVTESSRVDRYVEPPFGLSGADSNARADVADWILYYGMAIGLARTEEPCEALESVARRARAAANKAFAQLNWDSPGAAAVTREMAEGTPEAVA